MFAFDPGSAALVALLVGLYLRAVRTLRRRGYVVPLRQQLFWYAGSALIAFGLMGPPDALSGDLFSAHMAQHLVIADLAAPLLLAGMRTPVLGFLLPRSLLRPLARARRLRRALRVLRRPLVALPLWIAVLYVWHFGFAFEGALRHPVIHALQHESFFLGSLLVWWAVIEPERRRMSGELWKAGQIIGARVAGMFLGMAFIVMRVQAYPWYGQRARLHGLDPLTDQQIGGGLMLGLDLLVMFFALGFFFWLAARDWDVSQRRGAEPATASVPVPGPSEPAQPGGRAATRSALARAPRARPERSGATEFPS